MIFSSFTFLLLFMPCVLLLYRVMPPRLRMPFLLAASLFFYGWGNPAYLLLILWTMLLNWGGVLLPAYDGIVSAADEHAELVMEQGPAWYYNGLALVAFLVASSRMLVPDAARVMSRQNSITWSL